MSVLVVVAVAVAASGMKLYLLLCCIKCIGGHQ